MKFIRQTQALPFWVGKKSPLQTNQNCRSDAWSLKFKGSTEDEFKKENAATKKKKKCVAGPVGTQALKYNHQMGQFKHIMKTWFMLHLPPRFFEVSGLILAEFLLLNSGPLKSSLSSLNTGSGCTTTVP